MKTIATRKTHTKSKPPKTFAAQKMSELREALEPAKLKLFRNGLFAGAAAGLAVGFFIVH